MTKQKTFRIDHSGKTYYETVESIFSDYFIIYDSEVLLEQWVGKDNYASDFNVSFFTLGIPHYEYQFPDQNEWGVEDVALGTDKGAEVME